MTRATVVKKTTSVLVFVGVVQMVKSVAINNTDTSHFSNRLCVGLGSLVLGAMFADKACRYKDEIIDEILIQFQAV